MSNLSELKALMQADPDGPSPMSILCPFEPKDDPVGWTVFVDVAVCLEQNIHWSKMREALKKYQEHGSRVIIVGSKEDREYWFNRVER